jgi:transcription initiation factor TFIIB
MSERTSTKTETESETEQATDTGIEMCPECSGTLKHDAEHGEQICTDCGLVVDENEIDRGPEWRAQTQKERNEKSRVGAPTTKMLHDDGVSTAIGWQNKDAYGNSLSERQSQKMARLRKWHTRSQTRDAQERNLQHALGEIDRMASALGLPQSIRETAGVIYRRTLDEDLLRGRSIEGVSTAAVYAASRQAGIPRSLDEITAVSRIEKIEVMRTYRYISRELNLEISPADPTDYLPRFASKLEISEEAEYQARELLEAAVNEGVASGKNPTGLAGAAIYAAALLCNEKLTQDTVSEVADVTQVTIRNRYKDLLELKDGIPVP